MILLENALYKYAVTIMLKDHRLGRLCETDRLPLFQHKLD